MSILVRPDRGRSPLILVGGVPGAGKSTAMRAVAARHRGVDVLDSDSERDWFARVCPRVPYRLVRPLVHLIHQLRVFGRVLRGPGTSTLIVHDPSTRWLRLGLLGWLARARGWDAHVLFVAVARDDALAGQVRRGRTIPSRSFTRHWRRWTVLEAALTGRVVRARWGLALAPWRTRKVVDRAGAAAALGALGAPAAVLGAERRALSRG